ncbi:hypothetical protein ACA910_014807 [Epithemia clementina (nom. ined.)]
MMWQCAELAVTLAPIALLYPIYWWNQRYLLPMDTTMDAQDKLLLLRRAARLSLSSCPPRQGPVHAAAAQAHRYHAAAWVECYFSVALQCVPANGAAVIKLMQWAGSRPDLFGYEFCAIFAQLQDHTKPHDWQYTKAVLEQALVSHWQERIIHIYPQPLGSGCIGQVYRGTILVAEEDEDHQVIVDVLSNFICCNGCKAGQCMIANSNRRRCSPEPQAVDGALFLDKMQALAWNAADPKKHLMEHFGSYISKVCEAASVHHIMLNPAFVSAALALKVQEAVRLSLDPQLEMWKEATPIIAESERRRRRLGL